MARIISVRRGLLAWRSRGITQTQAWGRARVRKEVCHHLIRDGWKIQYRNEFWQFKSLVARKGSVILVVGCFGADRRLQATDVKDLQRVYFGLSLHPVYIDSVTPDTLALAAASRASTPC